MRKVLMSWSGFILLCCAPFTSVGAQLQLTVISQQGKPLANIVVYAEPDDGRTLPMHPSSRQHPAIMDQINKQFVPHILVVQRTSWVDFPNSDSIKHHVYSFSKAKTFELKLYGKGNAKPQQFNRSGEVAMGCNIHDWMLGYIYVVDSPWFAKSTKQGKATLNVPEGKYQLKIWSPLLQGADRHFTAHITVPQQRQLSIKLNEKLLPGLNDYEHTDTLNSY